MHVATCKKKLWMHNTKILFGQHRNRSKDNPRSPEHGSPRVILHSREAICTQIFSDLRQCFTHEWLCTLQLFTLKVNSDVFCYYKDLWYSKENSLNGKKTRKKAVTKISNEGLRFAVEMNENKYLFPCVTISTNKTPNSMFRHH
jgi:hypothetical protein